MKLNKLFVGKSNTGSIFAVALIVVVVLLGATIGFLVKSKSDVETTGAGSKKIVLKYLSESAMNKVITNFKKMIKKRNSIDFIDVNTPSEYANVTAAYPIDETEFNTACMSANGSYADAENICKWLLYKNELSEGLEGIETAYDVDIVRIDKTIEGDPDTNCELTENAEKVECKEAWNWNVGDATQHTMPNMEDAESYKGLNTGRRIYGINLDLTSKSKSVNSHVELRIVAYMVPMWQWVVFSDLPLTLTSPGKYEFQGRIHSNSFIRFGNYDGGIFLRHLDYTNTNPLVTTSERVQQIFKFIHHPIDTTAANPDENPDMADSDVHVYYEGNVTFKPTAATSVYLWQNYDTPSGSSPSWWDCLQGTVEYCYPEINNNGFQYAKLNIKTSDADFQNMFLTEVPPIRPPWYPDPSDSWNAIDIIKPGNPATDSSDMKNIKKMYSSDLILLKGSDDVIRSYDKEGNVIDTSNPADPNYPLTYNYLVSNGIIQEENKSFYDTRFGQAVNSIKFNVQKFKDDANLSGKDIDMIYIGSDEPTEGEIQFPSPGCPASDALDGNYPPICVSENGTDCTASCDKNNIGTIDSVIITNGGALPQGGLTFVSNTSVYVQGNYNVTEIRQPSAIMADNLTHLSDSFETNTKPKLNPAAMTGPGYVDADLVQNFAYMTGSSSDVAFELPPLEKFKDPYADAYTQKKIIRNTSMVRLFESDLFPPRRGSKVVYQWMGRSYKGTFLHSPNINHPAMHWPLAEWITKQDLSLGTNLPPGSDWALVVKILSAKETEK